MLQDYEYVGWQDTVVSGWGTLSSGGVLSDTLNYVEVPPVSRTTCNQASSYNGQVTANMICAGKNKNTFANIDNVGPYLYHV